MLIRKIKEMWELKDISRQQMFDTSLPDISDIAQWIVYPELGVAETLSVYISLCSEATTFDTTLYVVITIAFFMKILF